MLKKIFRASLLVAAGGMVMAGCATGQAAAPADTSPSGTTTPSATTPPLTAPPLTLDSATLNPSLVSKLQALEPPEGSGRAMNSDQEPPISAWLTVRPCGQLAAWFQIALPELLPKGSARGAVVCGTDVSGDLPNRGKTKPAPEVTAYLIAAPPGSDVTGSTLTQLEEGGATSFQIYSGPNIWPEVAPTLNATADSGGYLGATFRGKYVGLQNLGKTTRLAWIKDTKQGKLNVSASVSADALTAAQALVESKNTP